MLQVRDYLKSFERSEHLRVAQLTKKMVMPLALLSTQRLSDLVRLSLYMYLSGRQPAGSLDPSLDSQARGTCMILLYSAELETDQRVSPKGKALSLPLVTKRGWKCERS